jgi:hypothetical protein
MLSRKAPCTQYRHMYLPGVGYNLAYRSTDASLPELCPLHLYIMLYSSLEFVKSPFVEPSAQYRHTYLPGVGYNLQEH